MTRYLVVTNDELELIALDTCRLDKVCEFLGKKKTTIKCQLSFHAKGNSLWTGKYKILRYEEEDDD